MQSYKMDEVVDRASKKKNVNRDLLKSISDVIFKETKDEMHRFSNLRIYLQGFIIFFYGKKRLEDFQDKINKGLPISFIENKEEGWKEKVKDSIQNLLDVYPKYIEEKVEVKTKFKQDKKNNGNSKEGDKLV